MALGLCSDNRSSGFGRKFREKRILSGFYCSKFILTDENHSYNARTTGSLFRIRRQFIL